MKNACMRMVDVVGYNGEIMKGFLVELCESDEAEDVKREIVFLSIYDASKEIVGWIIPEGNETNVNSPKATNGG